MCSKFKGMSPSSRLHQFHKIKLCISTPPFPLEKFLPTSLLPIQTPISICRWWSLWNLWLTKAFSWMMIIILILEDNYICLYKRQIYGMNIKKPDNIELSNMAKDGRSEIINPRSFDDWMSRSHLYSSNLKLWVYNNIYR